VGKRSKKRKLKQRKERKAHRFKSGKMSSKPTSFKDNMGNIIAPIELVFPILRQIAENGFEEIGTGFFVHPAGGFVTAKHCFYNGDTRVEGTYYAIHSVGDNQHLMREIQYFEPHPSGDIGVGMLRGQLKENDTNKIVLKASFPISLTPPKIDEEISTLAYPHMKIDKGQIGTFPCDKYAGKILEHYPDGTGVLKSECFRTNMEIKSGASGGPVLRGNHHIIGVNSTSMEIADDGEPISFITPIRLVFDLILKDSDGKTTTVKELMESGHMPWTK
jgi:V8-like Glu-specific endopeptidase